MAETPRPFGFLVSGAQGQGLFLLRHRAAVADDESVLRVVFSYHEPVFEFEVDGAEPSAKPSPTDSFMSEIVSTSISRPLQNSSYNLSFLNIFCTFMV